MKITKEKAVYFLSLNILVVPFLFVINEYFFSNTCQSDVCFLNIYDIYLLEFLFFVLPAIILTFIYANIKKDDYNIFYNSFLIGLIPTLFLSSVMLRSFIDFLMFLYSLLYLLSIYLLTFISSLVILKITDPLRRKIKW